MVTVGGTRSVGSCWQGSYRLQLRGGDSQEVWMSMGKQRVCKGEMVVQKYFGGLHEQRRDYTYVDKVQQVTKKFSE